MDVDDTDRQIVNALLGDGRASVREIASETGIPATTVDSRLDGLEAAGVVEGYEPQVDYAAFGYDVTAVFQLTVDGDGLPALTDRLRDRDQMVAVYEVTGSHDVIAVGKFTSTEAMNEEIKQLLTDPDVRGATTSVVLDVAAEFEQFAVDLEEADG